MWLVYENIVLFACLIAASPGLSLGDRPLDATPKSVTSSLGSPCAGNTLTRTVDGAATEGSLLDASTISAPSNFQSSCDTSSLSPERVFSFVPDVTGFYQFNIFSKPTNPFSPAVYIMHCRNGELYDSGYYVNNQYVATCKDESGELDTLTTALLADATYYIVVDGAEASQGDFRMSVSLDSALDDPDGGVFRQSVPTPTRPPTEPGPDRSGKLDDATIAGIAVGAILSGIGLLGAVLKGCSTLMCNGSGNRTDTEPSKEMAVTNAGDIPMATVVSNEKGDV